jgi:hypothetical protein
MKTLIATLLLVMTTFATAGVYKWIAPDGSVVYTDQPLKGAKRLAVPAWYPPPPPPVAPPIRGPIVPAMPEPHIGYADISVEKPSAGQYVREEGEGIKVAVQVKPRLHVKRGHRIQLLLDGEVRGNALPATTQRITDVDRGPHSVAAQVVAPDGNVLIQSPPVNFFYQRPTHAFTAPSFTPTYQHPVRAAPKAPRMPIFPRTFNVPPMRIAPPPPGP